MSDAGAVVLTGASTGIGRALALHLASRGHRVFAGVRRDSDAQGLRTDGGPGIEPVILDVTRGEEIAAAAARVSESVAGEGIAGLVNNAGIAVAGMLEFLPLCDLRRQLEVNLVGLLAVTQAFLPLLRLRHPAPGRIVNVGSTSGYLAAPLVGAYTASKFALEGLSDTLRLELAPFGIEVSLVEPGPIRTAIFEKTNADAEARLETLTPEMRRQYAPMIAAIRAVSEERARRAIPPETVARAVAHALHAARPRTRYRVGLDAKLEFALARLLPGRGRDFVLARYLGITGTSRRL